MTPPETPAGSGGGEAPRPRRNHYQRGRQLEWDARDALRAAGYNAVLRTAGSKGCVDILAFREGAILLIQAKATGNLPSREWNAVVDLAALNPTVCIPLMVERNRGLRWWQLTARKTQRGIWPKQPFPIESSGDDSG